jgi:hypothetical protein
MAVHLLDKCLLQRRAQRMSWRAAGFSSALRQIVKRGVEQALTV